MSFCSTRNSQHSVSLSQAVLLGIAPDGGLFFPEEIPIISPEERKGFSEKSFTEIAEFIFSKFAGNELSDEEIHELMHATYTPESFDSIAISPVKKLSNTLFLLELFHGPTGAFKDFALQFLPKLMNVLIRKTDQKERCILVATSGDTGGAALAGFADVPGTKCVVFFPKGGVSPLQQAQMQSAVGNNLLAVEIDGDFDEAQANIKQIFADTEFSEKLEEEAGTLLSSANSINIGRLLPQIFYAFSAHAQMVASGEISLHEEVDIYVPTGNFGDLFAAFLAKKMGLPLGKLTCASNANNTSAQLLETGIFDIRERKTEATASPAMDILKASNIERLLFLASGRDSEKVKQWQKELIEKGVFTIDKETLSVLKKDFSGDFVTDEETKDEIRKILEEYHYIVDPHTAVALRVVRRQNTKKKTLVFSTAHYGKFGETVFFALSPQKSASRHQKNILQALENICQEPTLPQSFYDVLAAKRIHASFCEEGKENMEEAILEFLKKKEM